MSREKSGWEWVSSGKSRWAPTTDKAKAQFTYDLYGHEYEAMNDELDDLIRAVQRDAAEKLIEHGFSEAAELIFPAYPEDKED